MTRDEAIVFLRYREALDKIARQGDFTLAAEIAREALTPSTDSSTSERKE